MFLEVGLLLLAVFMLVYYEITKQFNFFKDRGIPYAKPSFPFGSIGPWKAFTGKLSFSQIDQTTLKESGLEKEKVVGYFAFGQPTFIINDDELAKRVLIKDFDYFMDRREFNTSDKITGLFMTNLKGSEWKQMRTLMSGVFTSGKLKLMTKHIVKVGENFEKFLETIAEEGTEVDMKVVGGQMTLDSIATAGFGIETNSFDDPDNVFRIMALTLVGAPGYGSQFQMFRFAFILLLPRVAKLLNINFLDMRAQNFFANIIQKTYKHRMESDVKRNDIIDLIINEMKAAKSDKKEPTENFESEFEKDAALDTSDLKKTDIDEELVLLSNAILFFFAGFETTSTGFSIVCHKLALHQDMQERVFTEIQDILGDSKDVTFDQIQEMKFMDHFISESFRQQTILESHERACTKDYKIPGTDIIIPKGRLVKIFVKNFFTSKDNFVNPDQFDPENFFPENNPNKFGMMFFGHGPRNCIGMRYALLTIKISLVFLLRRYRVLRGPRTTDLLVQDIKNPNVFKDGVFMKIEKRS